MDRSYKPQRCWNLEQLSVRTKFIWAKFSNATSVGKNLNFNVWLCHAPPSLFFSYYVLLATLVLSPNLIYY